MTNCSVCGSSDLKLIDGYYYCVECGTQDSNVRETMFTYKEDMPDTTFVGLQNYGCRLNRQKVKTLKKTKSVEMTGEWHKWHAFNFVLHGLADELIGLGAKPSFKMKVLWIWTRYIKKYQNKKNIGLVTQFDDRFTGQFKDQEDSSSEIDEQHEENGNKKKNEKNNKRRAIGRDNEMQTITHSLLLSILYIALNLDKSDIQLSHLIRFVSEHRLTRYNYTKYIPKEINTKSFPEWHSYVNSCSKQRLTPKKYREISMSCYKTLHLGTPLVPDLRKMVDNYVKELCLPNEFKHLVLSLIHLVPCDFLELNKISLRAVRVPDYETVVLSYIVIALKMCFGLDGDCEIKLSKAVDEINIQENYDKSYKVGMDPECTGRLFSFHEWCNYLQLREKMVCKYYLPMAKTYALPCDYYAFLQQVGERNKYHDDLNAQLTMDIINKIPLNNPPPVIRKVDFPFTLTPMTTYTNVILKYIQDPEIKMLLSEDFTQYSLKYACEDLRLPLKVNDQENLFKGVSESYKTINPSIKSFLEFQKADTSMVYVRNCENKNWLKTNPPREKHVKADTSIENSSGQESDNDCKDDKPAQKVYSNENVFETNKEFELIIDSEDMNIFDDMFEDVPTQDEDEKKEFEFGQESEVFTRQEPEWFDVLEVEDNKSGLNIQSTDTSDDDENQRPQFNPDTFDRAKITKELILLACKEHNIPIPREYNPNKTPKRKMNFDGQNTVKKSKKKCPKNKDKPSEANGEISIKNIILTYYDSVQQDVLHKVAEEVKSVINNLDVIHDNTLNDNGLIEHESENAINDESIINNENNDKPDNMIEQNTEVSADKENREPSDDETDEEVNVEDLLPKINPNFDEKTHKTKQLYVKCKPENENAFFEEVLDIESPEIDAILQEKLEKFDCDELSNMQAKTEVSMNSDSEDELPLILLKEEKRYLKERRAQRKAPKENLIKNGEDVKKFKYWIRRYDPCFLRKYLDKGAKFDMELLENYPMSFRFVLSKCANILDRTPFFLCRCIDNIENKMLKYLKSRNKSNSRSYKVF